MADTDNKYAYVSYDEFYKFCENFSKKFKKHTDQLNGIYFGQNSAGKWGYKDSSTETITPF